MSNVAGYPTTEAPLAPGDRIAHTWLNFWFAPADPRPLAAVRILTGLLGLALASSYAGDLVTWFGPGGMIPPEAVDGWRPRVGLSPLDGVATSVGLHAFFAVLVAALAAVAAGFASQIACVVAALLWATLLNRGPMLAGPADDCLAVLLWCLAIGPCGAAWSVDRAIRDRRRLAAALPSPWASTSLGMLRVHATAITLGVLLAQLKGDDWWNGMAAWWLTVGPEAPLVDMTGLYRRSEYAMNLVTHGIVAFEILFAMGLWFDASRQAVSRVGLIVWPAIGLLAGEPLFGFAMATFCVPWTWRPRP